VRRNYHTIDKQGKVGERKLAEFLVCNDQALLPMLELIEQSRLAIDELIDVSVEAVLELSAREVAGVPQRGKARLRKKGRGENKEVPIPAYEALRRNATTGQRMLGILLDGVSTRRYQRVIPEMADTVGVSRSTVSREAIAASEAALRIALPITITLVRYPSIKIHDT